MMKLINRSYISIYSNAFIVLILLALPSCSDSKKVILTNQDGSIKLTYLCRDIRPQAESIEEIKIIYKYTVDVGMKLQKTQKYASLERLTKGDIKTKELFIVNYYCENATKK